MDQFGLAFLLCCFIAGVVSETISGALIMYLALAFMLFSAPAKAETYYSFKYNTKDELKISVPAVDYFEARTKASKICFQALTGGKYQGEEIGLSYVDICVNPEGK